MKHRGGRRPQSEPARERAGKPRSRKRKPTTPAPLHRHNDPIGFSSSKLSPAAKLVLRVGHKYAFRADLRRSLSQLVQETDKKYAARIKRLSDAEGENWRKWKLRVITDLAHLKQPPLRIESMIRNGIRDLKAMEIVIKQADKNLGLVPIRGDIYAAMIRKWLAAPSFARVDTFPHVDILRRIENTIRYTRAISAEEKEQWLEQATLATEACPFYVTPKIHKKQALGSRPISATHSYMLAPLSKALTAVLLREQAKFTGITQDTRSFVRYIEEFHCTSPFVFLTYDVEACYPSIDLNDAIKTLRDNLVVMRQNNDFWTKILQLVMFNNYVSHGDKLFRQMIGTATGTQVAPPFANLYLFFKYREVLSDPTILLQQRFIDDGFVLVSSSDDAKRVIRLLQNASSLKPDV